MSQLCGDEEMKQFIALLFSCISSMVFAGNTFEGEQSPPRFEHTIQKGGYTVSCFKSDTDLTIEFPNDLPSGSTQTMYTRYTGAPLPIKTIVDIDGVIIAIYNPSNPKKLGVLIKSSFECEDVAQKIVGTIAPKPKRK